MAIIRQKREKHFSIVSNEVLNDKRLSFKARGLLVYMLSMKDDWKFYTKELAEHSERDGIKSIRSALNEIEAMGYLERTQTRGKHGHFEEQDWKLLDTPRISPEAPLRHAVGREAVERQTANGTLTITNRNNNLTKQELNNNSRAKSTPHHDDYEEIIGYLNKKTGRKYSPKTKKYQNLIKARFNEGFTVADFKKVIDNKNDEWANDPKMKNYIRPTTLFGSKFDDYLNQEPVVRSGNSYKKVERGTDWSKKAKEKQNKTVDPFEDAEDKEKLRNFFKDLEQKAGM